MTTCDRDGKYWDFDQEERRDQAFRDIKKDKPIRLRYRLVVHDGPPPVELLKELTAEWKRQ